MECFGRLFTDDICISHTADNEASFEIWINIDLQYLTEWYKKWLLKVNPNKTHIMIFLRSKNPPVI